MNKMTEEERNLAKSFPERVSLRDTGLRDDLGGAGQRILTTAGQGYPKVTYVRADLAEVHIPAGTTGYLGVIEVPVQKEVDPEHEVIMSKETLRVWRFLLDHNPKALATYMDDLDLTKCKACGNARTIDVVSSRIGLDEWAEATIPCPECRPESVSAERPPSWWNDLNVAWTEIVNARIPGKRMVIDDTTLCRWANAMNCALAMTRPSADKRYSVRAPDALKEIAAKADPKNPINQARWLLAQQYRNLRDHDYAEAIMRGNAVQDDSPELKAIAQAWSGSNYDALDVRAFRRPVEFWLNDLDENDPDDRLDIDRGKRLLNQIDEWEKAHG